MSETHDARDRGHRDPDGLTPAELEAESAEALPERAAMSTLSVSGLDATAGTVEAVGDGVTDTAAAATDAPVDAPDTADATATPEVTTTAADTGTAETTEAPDATTTAEPINGEAPAPEHPGAGDHPGHNPWTGDGPGQAAEHSAVAAERIPDADPADTGGDAQ